MTRDEIEDCYKDEPQKRAAMLQALEDGRLYGNVHIPDTECCGRAPWDCECERSCVTCREVGRGQGLCGNCYGGR